MVTHLDRYRMAGHDLRVTEPIHVSLEIDMLVCVHPDYFRSHVREGLLDVFSRFERTDGTRGLFHPDNFSFGQTVITSYSIHYTKLYEVSYVRRRFVPPPENFATLSEHRVA